MAQHRIQTGEPNNNMGVAIRQWMDRVIWTFCRLLLPTQVIEGIICFQSWTTFRIARIKRKWGSTNQIRAWLPSTMSNLQQPTCDYKIKNNNLLQNPIIILPLQMGPIQQQPPQMAPDIRLTMPSFMRLWESKPSLFHKDTKIRELFWIKCLMIWWIKTGKWRELLIDINKIIKPTTKEKNLAQSNLSFMIHRLLATVIIAPLYPLPNNNSHPVMEGPEALPKMSEIALAIIHQLYNRPLLVIALPSMLPAMGMAMELLA